MEDLKIYWTKIYENARIPTKRDEDAGFDIYTVEDKVLLRPNSVRSFSTGIKYVMTPGYWLMGFDRGSTGSKGIHLHCGVCDNGYRGEIFVILSNSNDYPVYFTSAVSQPTLAYKYKIGLKKYKKILLYPTGKGICQLIPVAMPHVASCEVSAAEFMSLSEDFKSERGETKLGQSGK